jgi:hypothetical protein
MRISFGVDYVSNGDPRSINNTGRDGSNLFLHNEDQLAQLCFSGFSKWYDLLVHISILLLIVFSQSLMADSLKLTVGAEYSSGDFGGDSSIDEWYIPITGKYFTDNYLIRVTVPYIRVTAPEGTAISTGEGGEIIETGSGLRVTEQGLGDIIAAITVWDVLNSDVSSDVSLDFTGKVKIGSADEYKGLGTGENDYTAQAALYIDCDQFTPYLIAGYTFRGDPPGINLNNVWFGIAGGMVRFTPDIDVSIDYYYREASHYIYNDQKELTLLMDLKLDRDNKVQAYVLQGFSDGSPDWGIGVMYSIVH